MFEVVALKKFVDPDNMYSVLVCRVFPVKRCTPANNRNYVNSEGVNVMQNVFCKHCQGVVRKIIDSQ